MYADMEGDDMKTFELLLKWNIDEHSAKMYLEHLNMATENLAYCFTHNEPFDARIRAAERLKEALNNTIDEWLTEGAEQ